LFEAGHLLRVFFKQQTHHVAEEGDANFAMQLDRKMNDTGYPVLYLQMFHEACPYQLLSPTVPFSCPYF